MSALAPKQAQFAAQLAHFTGLSPRVVGAWLLAEQSGSAARYYEGKGYNNWLNIARTDSGDKAGSKSSVWAHPDTAARATAEWLQGKGAISRSYGAPAPGIRRITAHAGRSEQEQIHAIADSGWASSGYNGGHTLEQLLGQVGHLPKGAMGMSPSAIPDAFMPGEHPHEGNSGDALRQYAESLQHAKASNLVAKLFTGAKPGDEMLRGLLQKELPAPPTKDHSLDQSAVSKVLPGVNTRHLEQGSGTVDFEGKRVAAWIAPALQFARAHGWKGVVNSGYRSYAEQKKIWDSGVRPAAVPGTSNHEGDKFPRGAVDVSDPEGLNAILRRSPYANKLIWAGPKGDHPHFSHPHGGAY